LLPIQRTDGFWNASLHDPNNFGGKETSGTALFLYGMAWGVNNSLLNAKKYTRQSQKHGTHCRLKRYIQMEALVMCRVPANNHPKDNR